MSKFGGFTDNRLPTGLYVRLCKSGYYGGSEQGHSGSLRVTVVQDSPTVAQITQPAEQDP